MGKDGFPGGLESKEFTSMQETWVGSLGWEDHLEKGKRHVYPNVHRSTVDNSQDMEAT